MLGGKSLIRLPSFNNSPKGGRIREKEKMKKLFKMTEKLGIAIACLGFFGTLLWGGTNDTVPFSQFIMMGLACLLTMCLGVFLCYFKNILYRTLCFLIKVEEYFQK